MSKQPEWSEQDQRDYLERINEAADEIIAEYLATIDNLKRRQSAIRIVNERGLNGQGIVDTLYLVGLTLASALTPNGPWSENDIGAIRTDMQFNSLVDPIIPLTDQNEEDH
ncbi:hypothetical protein C5C24_01735 [Rathayibacter sp. AY2B3]|uniref:hypothetical protein n=1 Tax=Rathayibacter sp. AY2B3 TaxID=2080569 RepID=UPI000CE871CD|nr:hypothetical protein [Rathayibacter sp. AY2B3]PPG53749.1 hypothetical protein C5C24_01735 [Rathayibacter sp. AY2B3]